MSIAYVLVHTLFGGMTPLVTTGNLTKPGIYLGVVTLLSLGCLAASIRLLGEPDA